MANTQAGSVPFRLMRGDCQLMVVHGDGSLESHVFREPQVAVRRGFVFGGLTDVEAVSHWDIAAAVSSDGRVELPFLRVWLTRMRHRPILGDRFRVQHVTD